MWKKTIERQISQEGENPKVTYTFNVGLAWRLVKGRRDKPLHVFTWTLEVHDTKSRKNTVTLVQKGKRNVTEVMRHFSKETLAFSGLNVEGMLRGMIYELAQSLIEGM